MEFRAEMNKTALNTTFRHEKAVGRRLSLFHWIGAILFGLFPFCNPCPAQYSALPPCPAPAYAPAPYACCPTPNRAGPPVCPGGQAAAEYYQPVQIRGPQGTQIALAANGQFLQRKRMPQIVGLVPGKEYRARITDIPNEPGKEIFPTVKIFARTFPPKGMELEFPIIIDVTLEDIELALNGRFITRVIYLEDPRNAIDIRGDLDTQPSMDAFEGIDPMTMAASMGQPVAILQMGGRVPATNQRDQTFYLGFPAWVAYDKTPSGRIEVSLYQNKNRANYSASAPIPRTQSSGKSTPIPMGFAPQPNYRGTPALVGGQDRHGLY